jgi:hypothetical protein
MAAFPHRTATGCPLGRERPIRILKQPRFEKPSKDSPALPNGLLHPSDS